MNTPFEIHKIIWTKYKQNFRKQFPIVTDIELTLKMTFQPTDILQCLSTYYIEKCMRMGKEIYW